MTAASILGTIFQWLGYAIYNVNPPAAVNGQPCPLQCDASGNLLVNVAAADGGGGGGGGAAYPVGSTDTTGGAVPVTLNAATWNRSAAATQNNYELPADTANWPHTISWQSGVAPLVTAPAGWHVMNPVTGSTAGTTYLYGSGGAGVGETWDWVSDVADQIVWPK